MAQYSYNYNYNKSFKTKEKMSPRTMMSIIAALVGALSFCFFAGTGIDFDYLATGKADANIALGNLVWGGGDYGAAVSTGLVVAFFLTIGASLIVLGTGGFHYIGYLAFLMFVAAGVLTFCAIPLCYTTISIIGKGTAYLGWGSYAFGILQVIAGVLSFVAAFGD